MVGVKQRPPVTPSGEDAHPELYDPQLYWEMKRSRWAYVVRLGFVSHVVEPIEDCLFARWLHQARLSDRIEAVGLPRRSIEAHLGSRLELRVIPQQLVQHISITKAYPDKRARRKAQNVFIWRGDWDRQSVDFTMTPRYRFINDIWHHRENLSLSDSYQQFSRQMKNGEPFRSHQKGVLLNTPEKIESYLRLYVNYMLDMSFNGFDKQLGKDKVSVAINQYGEIIKLQKGLHRLAMAQVLGLDEITVSVRAVHGLWWQQVTQGEAGERALERMVQALPACRPAG